MATEFNKKKEKTNNKNEKKEKLTTNEYKIIFIGESAIGAKTTLIDKISKINDGNSTSNFTNTFISKHVNIGNNKEIILQLWDTAGNEKYRSLTKLFLKDSTCIILGYDITRRRTFEEIKDYWCHLIYELGYSYNLKYLIGNKKDLEERRQVSEEEAILFSDSEN